VPNLRDSHVDIVPSHILRDDRNGVGTHRSSTYYVAELHEIIVVTRGW